MVLRTVIIRNILALDRIDAVGIFHIGEIHDTETASLRKIAVMPVLAELVKKRLGKCRKLVVIYHHGKTFRGVLPDERVYNTARLARTRSAENDGATEGIDDVYPTLVHLPLEIVYHRDIHRVRSLGLFLRLLERLVLKVETVFADPVVVIFRDAVETLMHEHGAVHRTERIYDAVGGESEPVHADRKTMEKKTQPDKGKPGKHRAYYHSLQVEFKRLLRLGPNADHTDADKFGQLAPCNGVEHLEASEKIENELRDTVVSRYGQIHHNLDYQEYIDTTAEVVIHLPLLLGFFKSHKGGCLERNLEAQHEAVAECVAVQEIHIVFLYDGELTAVGELTFHGTELRAEAEAAVLILYLCRRCL